MEETIKLITEKTVKYLEELELSDYFVVEVLLHQNRIEVFVDSDHSVSFTACSRISRRIEEFLDESQILGEKYILDVSSPGLDKPLKLIRQYKKNIGREITVTLQDKTKIIGFLIDATDNNFTLNYTIKEKLDNKNIIKNIQNTIAYDPNIKVLINIKF